MQFSVVPPHIPEVASLPLRLVSISDGESSDSLCARCEPPHQVGSLGVRARLEYEGVSDIKPRLPTYQEGVLVMRLA